MEKFDFKLSGLLKLREFREKNIKTELGMIVKEMQEVKIKLNALGEHISEAYTAQGKLLEESNNEGSRSGEMLKFFPYFIDAKRAHIKNQKDLLKELEEKYRNKIVEMKVAMGEVKVIESLKEKEVKKYKKYKLKKEYENIEELRIMRTKPKVDEI